MAVDGEGNRYVASSFGNRVVKVDPSGLLTTVAGNGTSSSFSGDGGPGPSATLAGPRGVAVDGAGNLFIADTEHHRVRRVDDAGVITTVAGTGGPGFSGDSGLAMHASLSRPFGVAVDEAGNLFIADSGNHRIRKVDTSGVISTVAGDGIADYHGDGGPATSAGVARPTGVAVDGAGNLFIATPIDHRIRRVNTLGVITTVAGDGIADYHGDGGPATSARLAGPTGVAVDGAGNLFIADSGNLRIRKVDTAGVITTIAGNGTVGFSGDGSPATSASLRGLRAVAVDGAGNLFITDNGNHRIRTVDPAGVITTIAGNGTPGFSGDGGAASSASFSSDVVGVAVDGEGDLFIADRGNLRIRKVDASGVVTTVAGNGIFGFFGDGGPATDAQMRFPHDVAVDGAGNLFIADSGNNRIRRVDTSGVITTVAGNGTCCFSGDGGPAIDASLGAPEGVAVDRTGNLYIATRNRIRKVDTSGVITTVAGTGTRGFSGDGGSATDADMDRPLDVAVDGEGNLHIADSGNHRIRRVDTSGVITTVAGTGTRGFSGDGGSATDADMDRPFDVAVDTDGNLLIADSGNDRIRRVVATSDQDADGVADDLDNCLLTANPAQSDVDADGSGDLCDPCPADASDVCDAAGSAAAEISAAAGGVLTTPDGALTLDFDPGDLASDETISVTQTRFNDPEADLTLTSGPGKGQRIAVYDLQPDGLVFDNPVTLTVVSDVSSLNPVQRSMLDIYLEDATGDLAPVAGSECHVVESPEGTFSATCTVELAHFSVYALVAPLDSDDDGVPDRFAEFVDVCPASPNVVDGFHSPMAELVPVSDPSTPMPEHAFRQGRTIPLKLRFLCGSVPQTPDDGIAPPAIDSLILTGDAIALDTIDPDPGEANDDGLLFRFSDPDLWVHNLSTKDLAPGTYEIRLRLPDGTLYKSGLVLR